MDVFRKCLHVFDILHNCVDKSCVCQLSLNEYMMMLMMMMIPQVVGRGGARPRVETFGQLPKIHGGFLGNLTLKTY